MIVAVGNPVYDFIKTPYVTTGTRVLSGSSTIACLVASKLGVKSALIGCVGKDYYDDFILDTEKYGIDHKIQIAPETGGFSLIYDERGDRELEVLGIADPIDTFHDDLLSADWIHFGPILGEVSPDLVKNIASRTRARLMFDPQGMMRRIIDGKVQRYRNPELDEVFSLFDVVKPNEYEAEIITGIDPREDAEGAASELYRQMHQQPRREGHPAIAVVTMAEAGSIVYDGATYFRIPAYKTFAKDPTGAGDSYAGGMMISLSREPQDLMLAGCYASSVASIKVESTGPEFPLTQAETLERLARVKIDARVYTGLT
ncbi:MAG: PfkB family carbohydrate kinase [Chloroflexota bacterium]